MIEELSKQKIYIKEMRRSENGIKLKCLSIGVEEYISNSLSGDYKISADIYNTVKYGVPQTRERFVMIGVLRNLGVDPIVPVPTIASQEDFRTVEDAIRNLEGVEPGYLVCSDGVKVQEQLKTENNPLNCLFDSDVIHNHFITKSTKVALERCINRAWEKLSLTRFQIHENLCKTRKDPKLHLP